MQSIELEFPLDGRHQYVNANVSGKIILIRDPYHA